MAKRSRDLGAEESMGFEDFWAFGRLGSERTLESKYFTPLTLGIGLCPERPECHAGPRLWRDIFKGERDALPRPVSENATA